MTDNADNAHLRHDGTDVEDALDDGVAAAGDGDRPFRGVGKHLTRHLGQCSRVQILQIGNVLLLTYQIFFGNYIPPPYLLLIVGL